MKRKSILLVAAMLIALQSPVSAVTIIDSQIDDELNKKAEQEMVKNAKDLNEKITFTKVNSCESMEKVMNDFLETYKKLHPQRTTRSYYWGEDLAINSISTQSMKSADFAVDSAVMAGAESIWATNWWVISDYSTTNIQKAGVDEPEILKSNGKYLFYYAEPDYNEKYVSIIKTPTNKDLSDAEIAAKINIPSSIYNTQLFLNGNKLIILGTRYASKSDSILGSNRTLVIVYDISDLENLKLEKLTEVYGSFEDARMIW